MPNVINSSVWEKFGWCEQAYLGVGVKIHFQNTCMLHIAIDWQLLPISAKTMSD